MTNISHFSGGAMPTEAPKTMKFTIRRENKGRLICLTCDAVDDFYVAVLSEADLRRALERNLGHVMREKGYPNVKIVTDDNLDGPSFSSAAYII